MITLYHGTSSKWRSRIKREGFTKDTWFTTSADEAMKYAEWAVMRDGGREADLWIVEFDSKQLDRAWDMVGIEIREGSYYYKFPFKPKPLKPPSLYSTKQ